ncbi:Shedu anti-phage system protein SduA domain-containing protein [Amycolatopsis sp. NPDC049868]|uniref:Shedu anti-phage system protein SduA domain-containing protein n=1 Tax=Amycolatopsis sp. NPDC049868 TaxID=3363934 RepID=UPI00378BCCC0
MYIRSDSVLKYLLLAIHEQASDDEVAQAIMDTLEHIGTTSPYRGGRQLLNLLQFAKRTAQDRNAEHAAQGLIDALAYASGKMLEEDLNHKYPLYSGSGQDDTQMLERTVSGVTALAAQEIADYLKSNPGASGEDLRDYFARQGQRPLRFARARRQGHYGAFRIRSDIAAWIVDVLADRIDYVHHFGEIRPSLDDLLALPDVDTILTAAQITRRRRQLAELRQIVENRYSSEEQIRKSLSKSWWIFGGKFIGELARRRLTIGMEADIPLLRPDGVLHIVELKKANVEIIKQYRGGYVPTSPVHNAVGQAANYLRQLDEDRNEITERLGVETSRSFATVVIGHPMFQPDHVEAWQINGALRTYGSHLSRIDIMTYAELLDSAERSLDLEDDANFSS